MSKYDGLSLALDELEEYGQYISAVKKDRLPVNIIGVSESAVAHLIFCTQKAIDKPVLLVVPDGVSANKMQQDLELFNEKSCIFPEKELVFYDIDASFKDITAERLNVLSKTFNSKTHIVITTISGLLQPTLPPDVFISNMIEISVGDTYEPDALIEKLVYLGYTREDMVEGKGQFAMRGGILDFFPNSSEYPYRVEFFDDEIDSIRFFDPITQRSVTKVDSGKILPFSETIMSSETRLKLFESLNRIEHPVAKRDAEKLMTQSVFPSIDKYIPSIYPQIYTIADYFTDGIVFFCEPKRISESAGIGNTALNETITAMIEKDVIVPQKGLYRHDYHDMVKNLSTLGLIGVSGLSHSCPDYRPKDVFSITSKTQTPFHGKPELFHESIEFYKNNHYRVIILAGTEKKAEHIANDLIHHEAIASYKNELDRLPERGEIFVLAGELNKGFEYPLIQTVVISDKEIFGSHKHKAQRPSSMKNRQRIMSYSDLSVGDYIVHQNHGIGQFTGIKQLAVGGVLNDYIQIQYSGADSLYIPVNQLDMVYKYIGKEDSKIKLNKLGGTDWTKTKQRVKNACKDMADQLIKLYAARQETEGHPFSPDTPWQLQFEDGFPYEETEDQNRCIDEVKSDMELSKPMDRLLCGDVGYGKTEVALRAAFKAVMDGYSVAYLVPTTILASQHYNTFVQRMKDFPITVEMLSRFRSPKQQKEIIKRLNSDEVDIIIGTHRILQKDLQFNKLGLLIIDEEQRFGVGHKEKIKELKSSVDVLTLTATPIPRTLHMSLAGIRDMSIIERPPKDRYPVATYVLEYDFDILSEAILKEVARNGQVYYLHNRVQSIYKAASTIQRISPDLRVAVAHGQMNESELEEIMLSVINNEVDILVCTTIIETGLDISNINTIIIEDADRMGLSQLYQLRGRVGRSNKLAYAYLTYKRDKMLSETAEKRLRAIKEFTEFGSGFKIALRDLEIRGAGNVIGAEQHGHMDAVGYELFCKLLSEAVAELKGEKQPTLTQTIMNVPVDAYIPKKYIKGDNYRIEIYKQIAGIQSEQDYFEVYDEIEDRYGSLPETVNNLIEISYMRSIASSVGVSELEINGKNVILKFEENAKIDLEAITQIMSEMKGQLLFSPAAKPNLTYRGKENKPLQNIKIILQKFKTLKFSTV